MKRLLYIILALVFTACSSENIFEENLGVSVPQDYSQISPVAYVNPKNLPPAATKALIDVNTVTSMESNALRIDESRFPLGKYESWEDAYILEATVSSAPSKEGLRSMSLNPVQAYSFEDNNYYCTRMISWYPRTCNLYKNDEGRASVMEFKDFSNIYDKTAYSKTNDKIALNFKNLDGSKDVMVSNIVQGQYWHIDNNSDDTYSFPFGHSETNPQYTNYMTYKHYMSAVKVYAYTDNSDQVVSMWGNIRKVLVRNQPSEVSVALPSPSEMKPARIEDNVQINSALPDDYGVATFSGNVDFPLIKTPMFGSDNTDPDNQEVAPDSPQLVQGEAIYLGYALIQPNIGETGQQLELDVHTDAGVLSVAVDMTGENGKQYFQPGYIYSVKINFNTEGAIADIVLQSGDDNYYDLTAGDKNTEDGTHQYKYANCYIIHPNLGDYDGYAFSATTIGNGKDGLYPNFSSDRTTVEIDPVRASLLWESKQGLITQVEYLYGYVRFKANPEKEGNAVIAVYDSQRKVLWSWHIWVTDQPSDVTHTIGGKEVKLMDRNLGATAANATSKNIIDTYGLYYQWGRKDPSMGAPDADYLPQSTATMEYYDYYGELWKSAGVVNMPQPTIRDGVENPMYLVLPTDFSMTTYQYDWLYTNIDNLWGDYAHEVDGGLSKRQKTIYDPCPYGYMVPQDEISTLFASIPYYTASTNDKGYVIGGSFFPFAGYKGVDKGVSSLSAAWRYVGKKGDYMSSKIEDNGHRSRTYISKDYSWIEYGADADNDGDGDASRTYNSYINADDVANRRTAASVRCVKRESSIGASLSASFIGNRTYAFVGEGEKIKFTYDIRSTDAIVAIDSAYIDLEGKLVLDLISAGQQPSELSGSEEVDIPSTAGLARYRLVATATNGIVSRVSYMLRLFDIQDLKIDDENYSVVKCNQNDTYRVSFILQGVESDFTVLVNGSPANKGAVTTVNNVASMSYSIQNVKVPGHLHIQILDAEGGLACEKTYEVAMSDGGSVGNMNFTINTDVVVNNVSEMQGGQAYVLSFSGSYYNDYYCLGIQDGKLALVQYDVKSSTAAPLTADFVFRFHRDDTKKAQLTKYNNVCAGALVRVDNGQFLKQDFYFGTEAEAVYVTIANATGSNLTSQYAELFLQNGDQLYYNGTDLAWSWMGAYYQVNKWNIYPVTITTK